ncbi:MAG TPA: ABC transporter substrate-binding protein [Chloroflexota bacterium]|nr:ABC transporter substrate-binding protein [Chloroflexota bacterium]
MGTRRLAVLLAFIVATGLVACSRPAAPSGGKPTVRIGSTNFPEQLVLAELYGQVLEANGYSVERHLNLGTREIVAPALESGQIDMYPEYLATYLTFVTKDPSKASSDPAATQRALQDALQPKGITVLNYAPAVDTNGLVVTSNTATRDNISRVSDLVRFNDQFVLGGPPECPDRPFCLPGFASTYGLRFKEFKALDAGGPLTVTALKDSQVDVAVLFTTDARIQTEGFVLLEDDKHLQLADNVAPVVRNDLLSKASADFKDLVNAVSAKVTTQELTGLNKQVGVDKKDAKDVAAAWLKTNGLTR